jgi:hypothetical protein
MNMHKEAIAVKILKENKKDNKEQVLTLIEYQSLN